MEQPIASEAVFTEYLDPSRARALAGLLGAPEPTDELPLLWHWVYLLPTFPQDQIEPDGHPLTGIPAPPGPGMRRMFASGTAQSMRPLRLGEQATRRTKLVDTRVREGRSGTLTFATVRTVIEQDNEVAVEEEQTIVYRQAVPTLSAPAVEEPAEPPPMRAEAPIAAYVREVVADPVLLFRFSALTYNSHRIHYDREYATTVEGYPRLVVHGPLQALLMLEAARAVQGALATDVEFRLNAPSFDGQQLWITADPDGAHVGSGTGAVRTAVHSPTGESASGTAWIAPRS